MKDKLLGLFRLQPVSRNSVRGFTIIELLVVMALLSFIVGSFLHAMTTGQFANTISSARTDLQGEVRRAMGWITKDVRQAVSWEIANNNPSPSYIKFRQVTGWDYTNNTFALSNSYIEYSYDSVSHTITRRASDGRVWTFNYVFAQPFYTIDSTGAVVPLNNNDLLTSKRLVITISGKINVIGQQDSTYSLAEEVQIRNG